MITFEINEKKFKVFGANNYEFSKLAKNLGGEQFYEEYWQFDIRELEDVRAACLKFFGENDKEIDKVDLKVTYLNEVRKIVVYGHYFNFIDRQIAYVHDRDSGAKCRNIILKEGGFDSGGSIKNFGVVIKPGTVFLMRDVSRQLAEHYKENDAIECLDVEITDFYKIDKSQQV